MSDTKSVAKTLCARYPRAAFFVEIALAYASTAAGVFLLCFECKPARLSIAQFLSAAAAPSSLGWALLMALLFLLVLYFDAAALTFTRPDLVETIDPQAPGGMGFAYRAAMLRSWYTGAILMGAVTLFPVIFDTMLEAGA